MIKLELRKLRHDEVIWPDFKTNVDTKAWNNLWGVTRNIARGIATNAKYTHKYNRGKYD